MGNIRRVWEEVLNWESVYCVWYGYKWIFLHIWKLNRAFSAIYTYARQSNGPLGSDREKSLF
jgi:hypothetical protein